LRELGYQTKEEKKEDAMSEESLVDHFRDDYVLLIEAGFVAVKQLDEIAARRLFKAAELLNPDNPASQLGLGYIALNKLQVNEATKIFEGIIKKEPKHYLAQALLGVCYMMNKAKRKKGEQLIQDAQENSDDPTIKKLASSCIDWAEKDLKAKEFSPLTPQSVGDEE
jgi:predicted Zn-dependent protease